jgi:putative transposase
LLFRLFSYGKIFYYEASGLSVRFYFEALRGGAGGMIDKWLTANEIAELLSITKRPINIRANRENWPYRTHAVRGGKERRYPLAKLPADIQTAYAASIQTTLEDLQNRLKPASKPEKKAVIIPRYSGRGARTGEAKPLETVPDKRRRKAALRAKVIEAWNASGLKPDRFAIEYNTGTVIPEIRAQLGGTLSQSTLYLWLAEYEQHGEAGLAPKYERRGGNGASLDERAKNLLSFYYLNKNKPSIRKVLRDMEKDGITINRNIAYRYIRTDIPVSTKILCREGKKAYHDKCEIYISRDYTLLHSMQIAVGDHKTFDFVSRVKRADGWHIVRLFLTCITDMRSRKILGWHIDEVPSTLTIIRAIRMTVEQYGCPDEFLFDNGKDFKSLLLVGDAWNEQHLKFGKREQGAVSCVLDDLGSAVHFSKPYSGQSKPIERFFGFVAGEHDKSFESYVGSNTADRPDEVKRYWGTFDGAQKIPLEDLPTIEEVRIIFAQFAEWYNTSWHHSGQGMDGNTPDRVFEQNHRVKRLIPEDFQKYIWTRREVHAVRRKGVLVDGEWYYNEQMQLIIGERVEIRISIDDIGTGYIFNLKDGTYKYDADAGLLKDRGIKEENNRTVNRLRKAARKHAEKHLAALTEIRKDKKTQLQETRDLAAVAEEPAAFKVVGGEMLIESDTPQRNIRLVKNETPKRKLKGLFDAD